MRQVINFWHNDAANFVFDDKDKSIMNAVFNVRLALCNLIKCNYATVCGFQTISQSRLSLWIFIQQNKNGMILNWIVVFEV